MVFSSFLEKGGWRKLWQRYFACRFFFWTLPAYQSSLWFTNGLCSWEQIIICMSAQTNTPEEPGI